MWEDFDWNETNVSLTDTEEGDGWSKAAAAFYTAGPIKPNGPGYERPPKPPVFGLEMDALPGNGHREDTPPYLPRRRPDAVWRDDVGTTERWIYPDGTKEERYTTRGYTSLSRYDSQGNLDSRITLTSNSLEIQRGDGTRTVFYNRANQVSRSIYRPDGSMTTDFMTRAEVRRMLDTYRAIVER